MLQKKSDDSEHIGIDFIDRDCYLHLVHRSYQKIIQNCTELKIIFLYGAGGFGKTTLLQNCLKIMDNPSAVPLHINLEITDRDNQLDILIKFRKKLPSKHFYPLFDYAIQILWKNLNTSQIDSSFLDFTQNNLWTFIKSGADVVAAISAINVAPAATADLLEIIYTKLKSLYGKHSISKFLENINSMPSYELIEKLPVLLGLDIHKAFLNEKLVFVIDSYQQYSRHLIDPTNWLVNLINTIGYGLFVITSREKIDWSDALSRYVVPQELDELPVDEVEAALNEKFAPNPQLLKNIIKTTGCIPIYLDLAVKSLTPDDWKNPSYHQFYFKDKRDIVYRFLIHLPENEQQTIMTLSIVQIFNEEIFEYLIKDLNLPVSVTSFTNICKRSLVRNIMYDDCFYKIHDAISKNISNITDEAAISRIIESYIKIVRDRIIYHCTSAQYNMLFKHIIELIITNNLSVSETDTERILDIYFAIKESLLFFNCDDIKSFASYEPLNNLYRFLKALSDERSDSRKRLDLLESIPEESAYFGKHIKSLQLMTGYLKALCEGSQWLTPVVTKINNSLSNSDKKEWYYGQTKIFYGDNCIAYGKFQTGLKELQKYKDDLCHLIDKKNDYFQVIRHIAHGYRFNMFLDKAESEYRSTIEEDDAHPTLLQKVYILTNICETCCYLKPDEVFKIKNEAFGLAQSFNDLKSKGKICYSLAIAYLHKKEYELAEQCINDSIEYIRQDGYLAGELYAYMARAYYEYARYGNISSGTLVEIEKIQNTIQVYKYFSVPLAMMQGKYDVLKKARIDYEWLDFNKTCITYRKFFDLIKPMP